MRRLIFILLIGSSGISWGQTDTLYEENLRKAADLLFKNLDSSIYGPSLLNRSFSVNRIVYEQIRNDYSQTHEITDFLQLYQDLTSSYIDSNYMMSLDTFVTLVETEILRNQLVFRDTDELVIPFSLLYHNVSMIDSLGFDSLSFNQDSLSYFPLGNENDIYSKVLLKSCAPLEFEVDLGYREGYLKYVPELISLSPDISNLVLKLMLDKGMNRLIQPII